MAQDTRILGFVGIRVSKPSTQNQEPTVQPNRNAIVDTIYRTAEHGDSYRYPQPSQSTHHRPPNTPLCAPSTLALPTHTTIQKPLTGRPAGYYQHLDLSHCPRRDLQRQALPQRG
ncbi:hypothetical protein, partial [Corynebacterium belfantii]|uniref:hypothetical protein n=1 Tax=Corynebacterium belfantii TaxID=2014537 RepID=UPI001072380F